MNKKVLWITGAFLLSHTGLALAEDTGAGCGLGKMIWGDNKKIIQGSLAATTNGSSGSQTFGISSGTSGCANDGIVKNEEKVNVFVAVNFENLREDVANAQGEYLQALASLQQVPTDQQSAFFQKSQQHYQTLFAKDSDHFVQVLNEQILSL